MDGGRRQTVTPPRYADADRFSCLRLLRSRRVGPVTYHRLTAETGSAAAALAALPEIAKEAGINGYSPCPEAVIAAELKAARKAGARALWYETPEYPAALKDLDDAPPMLWALGRVDLLARDCIAVVGARNASSLGLRMARHLASDLGAHGQVVVSGLARGIDAAAHGVAIEHGTVAVAGGGVDVVYPRENLALREQIVAQGLIISEQPMGLAPMARHFPRRNRLISGLSRAVVVVEAAARSGSLMTARTALDQGRDVLAVPGHPLDARAAGTNILLRDGATLVRSAEDILEAMPASQAPLPFAPPKVAQNSPPEPEALAGLILQRLGPSPTPESALLREMPALTADITAALIDLELVGSVHRHAGGMWSRA